MKNPSTRLLALVAAATVSVLSACSGTTDSGDPTTGTDVAETTDAGETTGIDATTTGDDATATSDDVTATSDDATATSDDATTTTTDDLADQIDPGDATDLGDVSTMCETGLADCDADGMCEVDLFTDAEHCGGCDVICELAPNSVPACVDRACTLVCDMGFDDCNDDGMDGCEVDLRDTVDHCGACGAACDTAVVGATLDGCVDSACVYTCTTALGDCDMDLGAVGSNGCETMLTSVDHCGACGMACTTDMSATPLCTDSACDFECLPGFVDADGDPSNFCEVAVSLDTTVTNSLVGDGGSDIAIYSQTQDWFGVLDGADVRIHDASGSLLDTVVHNATGTQQRLHATGNPPATNAYPLVVVDDTYSPLNSTSAVPSALSADTEFTPFGGPDADAFNFFTYTFTNGIEATWRTFGYLNPNFVMASDCTSYFDGTWLDCPQATIQGGNVQGYWDGAQMWALASDSSADDVTLYALDYNPSTMTPYDFTGVPIDGTLALLTETREGSLAVLSYDIELSNSITTIYLHEVVGGATPTGFKLVDTLSLDKVTTGGLAIRYARIDDGLVAMRHLDPTMPASVAVLAVLTLSSVDGIGYAPVATGTTSDFDRLAATPRRIYATSAGGIDVFDIN